MKSGELLIRLGAALSLAPVPKTGTCAFPDPAAAFAASILISVGLLRFIAGWLVGGRLQVLRSPCKRSGGPGLGLEEWMIAYQNADSSAAGRLVDGLSPYLLPLFVSQGHGSLHASVLLEDCWLEIRRVRHTYRPGSPLLPWALEIGSHISRLRHRKADPPASCSRARNRLYEDYAAARGGQAFR